MLTVSVILVTRNEENYILDCVKSIEKQFSNNDKWELIVVDGLSDDRTVEIIKEHLEFATYQYEILNNPKKILSSGWNIGIKNAHGKYVIRPDAHSSLHPNYIKYGINLLKEKLDVVAVGGILKTKSKGFMGNIIKEALSLKVGVGNSSFRTAKKSGYYDTAVFAVYRKEIFNEAGYFNESLVRHQDNEMHGRIHTLGGRFYLCNKMIANYYCRDSFMKLFIQMFNIGRYLPYVMKLRTLGLRHYAPFAFLSLIIFLVSLSFFYSKILIFLKIIMLFYFFIVTSSVVFRVMKKGELYILFNILVIPLIHLSYGVGTLAGFLQMFGKAVTRN
jgi:glycosyltransferase involved in cell wall biosynthesis